jgi:thiol-disulfide isomerase/thioredoxin
MLQYLRIAILSLFAAFAIVPDVGAGMPFNVKAFQEAQAAGKTILVDVFAPWCPVCKRQQPTIQSLLKERPNLVVFQVDYDSSKDVLKRFNVQRQGTLILFKGANEVGRLIYDADPGNIRALVAKGF